MCKSVRGAAFFGSSIHLAFSFVFLFWFVFDTLISEININLWKCDPPEQKFSEVDPLAHYLNLLFKLLYFTGLSVTGVYIFRGVEREKPQLLKYATLAFVIIQVLGVILFSVFFSIQWNAEPEESQAPNLANLEVARLVGEASVPGTPQGSCCQLPPENPPSVIEVANNGIKSESENTEHSLDQMLKEVTPVISENVLVAPDLNDTTTTTTTPLPPPPKVEVLMTTTSTTTQAPELRPPPPCTTPECLQARAPPPLLVKPPAKRLPHNQLVRLVLQMCFAVTNGLISVAYVIVLALYMLKL